MDYSSALATEEISQFTDADAQRQFKGIWTFEVDIVTIMYDWLTSLVDARPLTGAPQLNRDRQTQLVSRSIARLNDARRALDPAAPTQSELDASIRASGAAE